jgi:hypothetical protein
MWLTARARAIGSANPPRFQQEQRDLPIGGCLVVVVVRPRLLSPGATRSLSDKRRMLEDAGSASTSWVRQSKVRLSIISSAMSR